MTNSKRQQYGLGSFVKKFTRPIKKVLKSPLGKAALLGGLGWAANAGKLGIGSGWMSNLSNPLSSGKTNWLRNMFLAKGVDPGGRLSGGKLGLGALGLLAVGTPLWQKMMKTGPYEEIEEETGDWTIPSPNLANLLTRTKDYYRNYNPSLSNLSFQSAKPFVDPSFYAAKGGRAGYYKGSQGPAGGASAGGDYGGNVNPQQEYAGRTFQDTYRGGDGNTITHTGGDGTNVLQTNVVPEPNVFDKHRNVLTKNRYTGDQDDEVMTRFSFNDLGIPSIDTDTGTRLAKNYNLKDLQDLGAEKGFFGANDQLEALENYYQGAKRLTNKPTQTLDFNTPLEVRSKVESLGSIPFSGYESVNMDLVPKDFLSEKIDFTNQKSPLELITGKAEGGLAKLANGGGVAEAQAEQMLKMEYQKYRNQGGTMSYQQFKMAVLKQAQGQGPMAQGQPRMAQPQMAAKGGRIGKDEGGLMDMGGMEKDYRQEGGFVPIGGKEKADDVPARLSKNEFVFTADAVRNAGGGDIDQGAQVMENVMKNLEEGGEISEESQGAQGMYNNMKQLETRIA